MKVRLKNLLLMFGKVRCGSSVALKGYIPSHFFESHRQMYYLASPNILSVFLEAL
jgi:hypothetical protein